MEWIYILYILTGALCYFIGYASATYYTQNLRQDHHNLKDTHTRFIDELVKLNRERLDYKLLSQQYEKTLHNYQLAENRNDCKKNNLESKMQHYLTENKGLINKNKNLKNQLKQSQQSRKDLKKYKAQNKELEKQLNKSMIKNQRYRQEINNLHKAISKLKKENNGV